MEASFRAWIPFKKGFKPESVENEGEKIQYLVLKSKLTFFMVLEKTGSNLESDEDHQQSNKYDSDKMYAEFAIQGKNV